MLTQDHYIWNFNATNLLYIFIEERKNVLKLQKMLKNWSWKGIRQSRTKYLEQNGEIQETGQEKQSLLSIFACFLTDTTTI